VIEPNRALMCTHLASRVSSVCYRLRLWKKSCEVLDKEQVGDHVDPKHLLYDARVEVGRFPFRMQCAPCHKSCVKIGLLVSG
jgi:hypothetical protein